MPNAWAGAAEGFNSGVNNAIKILGAQQSQEEAGMKKKLFEQSAADWAYKHDKVIDTEAMLKNSGLDSQGVEWARKELSGIGVGAKASRQEMEAVKSILPSKEGELAGHMARSLSVQLKTIEDPVQKAEVQARIDKLTGVEEKAKRAKVEAEADHNRAAAESLRAGKKATTLEQTIAQDPTMTPEKALEIKKDLLKKESKTDPVAVMEKRLQLQDQYNQKKEEREAAGKARTAHEEKEATVIEKAGGIDKVNADTVKSWNRSRERLGMPKFGVKVTPGTLWGENTEITEPDAAVPAPVIRWTKDPKTGKPVRAK
jgi:hypothetical protein